MPFFIWMAAHVLGLDPGIKGGPDEMSENTAVAVIVAMRSFLRAVKDLRPARIPHSSRFFRTIVETPTLFLVGIAILAIVQPF